MSDGDRPFSEDVTRAFDLLGQFHRLRMTFDDDLRHDRRARRRHGRGERLETMSWDTKTVRSDELSHIADAYEEVWYRIHAVAPGIGGALPLPWLMRTGRQLPDWAERLRWRRAGKWFVSPRG